jgi:hypothetical protein
VLRGRHAYARNLLQLTQKMRSVADIPQPGCALGIFEGEILEKRIMNLIQNKAKQSRARASASVVFGICLFMVSCLFCAEFGLNPLAAQVDSGPAKAPAGWILTGSKPADYRVGIDKSVVLEGQPSAFLKSVVASSVAATDKATTQGLGPFGTMMQTVSAVNFAGKRVRFKAQVKSQDVADWAGLWMRYDRGREMLFLDNMQTRPIKGSQPWKNYEVVLDVPADATSISFGVLLAESGEVWMNQATFEVVGNDVAVTAAPPPPHVLPSTPKNLNFSE